MEKLEMPLLITFAADNNLDDIVNALKVAKNDNVNFFFDFYYHRLYSDSVTLEDAYKEIYNMTKEEYQKMIKEVMDNYIAKGNTVIGETDEEKLINFDRHITTRCVIGYSLSNTPKSK